MAGFCVWSRRVGHGLGARCDTFMGTSWGQHSGDGRMGWGSLPQSSLPLSVVVIHVGHPLCLVVGVQSHVRHLLGTHGAGMARGCWWRGGGGRLNVRALITAGDVAGAHILWWGRGWATRLHSNGVVAAVAVGLALGGGIGWRGGCVLQVVSRWVTGGGYALGAETAGENLPPSRVGLFLPGRVVTSLLHSTLQRSQSSWRLLVVAVVVRATAGWATGMTVISAD